MFSLAFARQVAVPAIADVLYRDGRGLILRDTRRRNDDTLIFFGELFRHGVRGAGADVIRRIRRAHAPYDIPNDLSLYTLATLACEPRRLTHRFGAPRFFSDREIQAQYHFWRSVAEGLGITDIPPDADALYRFYEEYEDDRYAPGHAGRRVTRALAEEFAARWFPSRLQAFGRDAFYGLFDQRLADTHGVAPGRIVRHGVPMTMAWYLRLSSALPEGRQLVVADHFAASYGNGYRLRDVGPRHVRG